MGFDYLIVLYDPGRSQLHQSNAHHSYLYFLTSRGLVAQQ